MKTLHLIMLFFSCTIVFEKWFKSFYLPNCFFETSKRLWALCVIAKKLFLRKLATLNFVRRKNIYKMCSQVFKSCEADEHCHALTPTKLYCKFTFLIYRFTFLRLIIGYVSVWDGKGIWECGMADGFSLMGVCTSEIFL